MRTEKDKMLAGELYDPSAHEIQADLAATHRWLARYNAALDMVPAERHKLLVERFAAVGNGTVIRPPFHCDYGFNIRLGAGVFLNFNCVILDVVEVTIGDRTQIGPGVQILAADHPRDPAGRASGLEFGLPVRIGRNVWMRWGLMPFVSTCLCSFELGLEKPAPEIFKLALERASCAPSQAVMIGDRLDNDIRPARLLGWKTIRVAQGFARFQSPRDSWDEPHLTVNSLAEVTPALIGRLDANVA